MKKTKTEQVGHTPGEWLIADAGDYYFIDVNIGEDALVTAPPVICRLDKNLPEAEANARLIAAAPDLFKMVKDLKNCVKRLSQDDLTQFDRDTEAQWEGEAHELLSRIDANYYRNANE